MAKYQVGASIQMSNYFQDLEFLEVPSIEEALTKGRQIVSRALSTHGSTLTNLIVTHDQLELHYRTRKEDFNYALIILGDFSKSVIKLELINLKAKTNHEITFAAEKEPALILKEVLKCGVYILKTRGLWPQDRNFAPQVGLDFPKSKLTAPNGVVVTAEFKTQIRKGKA